MKSKIIRIITFTALAAILVFLAIMSYSVVISMDKVFKIAVSDQFAISVQKESLWQLEHSSKDFNIAGINDYMEKTLALFNENKSDNDSITNHVKNIRLIQDSLYAYIKDGTVPRFSLEILDSIFRKESKNLYNYYSFTVTDSLGKQIDSLSHNAPKAFFERTPHKETIQLRNIAPEYITLNVSYRNSFNLHMGIALLIFAGLIIFVLFVGYSIIRQIKITNRLNVLAKLRQDFTHSMVHDLKNPVMSIASGINSLKSGKLDDKPQVKEHYYNIITQENERILRLVNKVLEAANLENASAIISKASINLKDLLSGLTEKYQANSTKPVHFHVELNDVETIYADPHYIYEAFDNLIENAVKYSKENKDADITVTSCQNGKYTQIAFKDMGIGIAKKDQKKIFQKFERSMAVINSPNKISGFGLGLNFVQQVVQAHGGTVKVNSRLGSYSEFIINLPTGDCR